VIDKPWKSNALHPRSDKGKTLAKEEQAIVPVLQRTEHYIELVIFYRIPGHLLICDPEIFFPKVIRF